MQWPLRILLASCMLASALSNPCLCIFDVDRTLTGKQWESFGNECSGNKEVTGVDDDAYGRGTLTLSVAGQHLNETFCHECYYGIVSAGIASGPRSHERDSLVQLLHGPHAPANEWDDNCGIPVKAPLVLGCQDGTKQNAVRSIVEYYATIHPDSPKFADNDVHFFDDRESNVAPFNGTGFNAHQISCASRDPAPFSRTVHGSHQGAVGFCGATLNEITPDKGVKLCA